MNTLQFFLVRSGQPDHLIVIYPGTLRYPLADRVEAVPLNVLASPDTLQDA